MYMMADVENEIKVDVVQILSLFSEVAQANAALKRELDELKKLNEEMSKNNSE